MYFAFHSWLNEFQIFVTDVTPINQSTSLTNCIHCSHINLWLDVCIVIYMCVCVCVVMLAAFFILFVLRSLKSVSWPIAIGLPPSSCLVWGPLNNFNFFLKTTKPIINYFWFQASLGRGECKLRNLWLNSPWKVLLSALNSEWTVSAYWTEYGERLYTVSKHRAQSERKLDGGRYLNARWTIFVKCFGSFSYSL